MDGEVDGSCVIEDSPNKALTCLMSSFEKGGGMPGLMGRCAVLPQCFGCR